MKGETETVGARLLEVRNLGKHFPLRDGFLNRSKLFTRAVDGVSFTLNEGETLGLVGESGSGKSTVGRLMLRLEKPTFGSVLLGDRDIAELRTGELKPFRRQVQLVHQDPYSSLNPRMSAGAAIAEPFIVHGLAGDRQDLDSRVADLFDRVGLSREHMRRYPHEFSGGQRQRLSIARALALSPRLIVADEPVSALDVSVQAQVINLFADLQAELGLAYLFVSHDIAVVAYISHRIAVMYMGKLVELAGSQTLLAGPLHPYTQTLIQSVPIPDPHQRHRRAKLPAGELPSPLHPPAGCRFHSRCPLAEDRCRVEEPAMREVEPDHFVACHLR